MPQRILIPYLGLLLFILLPVFAFDYPVMWDHLNHIARIEILHRLPYDEALAAMYTANWAVIPDLAYDSFVYAFGSIYPVPVAARLFIALTLILFTSGTCFLHRQIHGQWQLWPLLIFLFAWNGMLISGGLNYMFGLAGFTWAAGAWLAVRERWHPAARALVFSLAALGLFFCHLVIFVLWGMWLVADEFLRSRQSGFRMPDWLAAAVQALIPLWLFLSAAPLAQDGGGFDYGNYLLIKAVGIAFTYDALTGMFLSFAVMAVIASAAAFALWRKWIAVTSREGLLAVALILLYLALPHTLLSNYAVDIRLLIVVVTLCIAGAAPLAAGKRFAQPLAIALMMLLVHKIAIYSLQLVYFHDELAQYESAFSQLPPGAKLIPARLRFDDQTAMTKWLRFRSADLPKACLSAHPPAAGYDEAYQYHMMLSSVGALAASRRSVFYSNIFAHPGKQPLIVQPSYAALSEPGDVMPDLCRLLSHAPDPNSLNSCRDPERCFWNRWERDFDYLLAIDAKRYEQWPNDPHLTEIKAEKRFRLYQIKP